MDFISERQESWPGSIAFEWCGPQTKINDVIWEYFKKLLYSLTGVVIKIAQF